MIRRMPIFLILLLFIMQISPVSELIADSGNGNVFNLTADGEANTEIAKMTLKTSENFDKISLYLPKNAVYHESETKKLNNGHVDLLYKESEHILEASWPEEGNQEIRFILKDFAQKDNSILIKGVKSDEVVAEENYAFTVLEMDSGEEVDNHAATSNEKKHEQSNVTKDKADERVNKESDNEQSDDTKDKADEGANKESVNEQATITPFAGNLNVDIDISAQKKEVKSGNDAAFKLVFKTTGSMNTYTNAKIVVDLPNTELATFEQDTAELKINGVDPQLNEDNQLVYEFDTLKTGQTYENIIKLKTKSGITPNDTKLNINASFEADEQEKIEDYASVLVEASGAINVSKQFVTVHGEDSKIPLPNKQTVWQVKVDMPKTKTGQLYLEKDSEIQIIDELPDGLTYHSMQEGPEPTQDGNKLIWTFDAPTLVEQEEFEDSLFETEIDVVLTTGSNTADQELTNKATVNATFIENDEREKDANYTIKVFESDPATGDIEGSYYVPSHFGPSDDKGGLGTNDVKNPDPVVYDDAILAFDHGIAPLPESQHGDFQEYKTTYTIDEHLIFKELRTPNRFVYRPGNAWPENVPLAKDPIFNIEAVINGEHVVLVEDADVATVYTRANLNIADDAKVEQIIYNFTYAPSGMLNNGRPKYYFEVESGFVGEVKNTFNVHGTDANGNSFSKDYHKEGSDTIAGPRTAQIAEKPTDQPPIATVGVELTNHIGSFVQSGDNRMHVTLKTESSSTVAMTDPLNTVVLLPPGLKIAETPNADFIDEDGNSSKNSTIATGGNYDILDDNYNRSGRQLVKFNWNDRFLRPGNNVQAEINVTIDEASSNTLTFDVYGFSGDDELQVPDIDNPGLTDTVLQMDDEDLNNDGNSDQPRLKSGNEYYMIGQYNIKTEKLVKGELDEAFTHFGKTIPGGSIEYKLTLTNTIGKNISTMTLMDVLPSVEDLGITDNVSRGSKFTPTLEGPIQLPSAWEDKVEIYYSAALTPKRDDLIKNTIYPDTTTPLSNPDNVDKTNWLTESEVSDWSTIHSFKMELKDDVSWVSGEDITIQFAMKAPKFNEFEPSLVNKETNPKDRAAWNSFAIATDHGQPVEPLRVGVYMEMDTSVTLIKKGEDGETLEGAVFELQDADGNRLQKGLTTDSDGKIVVENLFYGSYQFVETEAPEGYDVNSTPLEFEITDAQEKIEVTFENPLSTGSVELLKVNENGDTLESAVFELQDENGNTLQTDLTTDSDGKIFIDNLKPGTYQFVETEAPSGYVLDDSPHIFDIQFNQQNTIKIEVENKKQPTEETVEKDDEEKPQGKFLPKTATNIYNFLLFGGVLLIIGITAAIYMYRKNKVSEE